MYVYTCRRLLSAEGWRYVYMYMYMYIYVITWSYSSEAFFFII